MMIALPIMLQNGITNFVNMLDNIMVGRIGTVEMTGVAVANQLFFVFNLCVFGAVSGAGIFTAQFHGNSDIRGVRDTFRFKMIFCFAFTVLSILLFYFFGDGLVSLYLRGEGNPEDAAASLVYAREYINIMLFGFIPYSIVQCYSSTLRETGKSMPPMFAGVVAVLINLVLNYILIFGHLGFDPMGVRGAAIATVISRFAELAIISIWTHAKKDDNQFIIGSFRSLRVPLWLVKNIMIKGMPLMVNEAFWASGMAFMSQCYSIRGYDVVSAHNISQTFFNVFSVAFLSVGAGIGIILGQILGSGETDKAMDSARKLITFSVMISCGVSALFFACASFIPSFYNTTDSIKDLAASFMRVTALAMPIDAFANATYFTLRSGGKVIITFLFDSIFVWVVCVPTAFILARFTEVPIVPLYAACLFVCIFKDVLGFIFVKKGIWIRNLTGAKA